MHRLVLLLLPFLVGTWIACQIEIPGHAETSAAELDHWVRTVDGWQRMSELKVSRSVYLPGLHPLLVALGQGLLSLLVLLAFPVVQRHRSGKKPGT